MRTKDPELLAKIYYLAIEGKDIKGVTDLFNSKGIKISYRQVNRYYQYLERKNYIRKIKGSFPYLYEKGHDYRIFEEEVKSKCQSIGDRGVKCQTPSDTILNVKVIGVNYLNFHHKHPKFKILKLPADDKLRWEKRGIFEYCTIHITTPFNEFYKVNLKKCGDKTLVAFPEPVTLPVVDGDDFRNKDELVDSIAFTILRCLSKFGYQLSLPTKCGEGIDHIAYRTPSLDKDFPRGQTMITDFLGVDSTGIEPGKPHIEFFGEEGKDKLVQFLDSIADIQQLKGDVDDLKNIESMVKLGNMQHREQIKLLQDINENLKKTSNGIDKFVATQTFKPDEKKEDDYSYA